MANENKIPEIIKSSLENIRSIVDANTVVGEPINTAQGTTIIPISKISVGIATGGVDYSSKQQQRPQNFGGGGGTGLLVNPVGFLVVDAKGSVEFINVGLEGTPDPIDQITDFIERTPDIIARIKDIFAKEAAKAEASDEE